MCLSICLYLPSQKLHFYSNAHEKKYFQITFKTTNVVASYNFQFSNQVSKSEKLDKRITDAFYAFHLLKYFKEFNINKPLISKIKFFYLL